MLRVAQSAEHEVIHGRSASCFKHGHFSYSVQVSFFMPNIIAVTYFETFVM